MVAAMVSTKEKKQEIKDSEAKVNTVVIKPTSTIATVGVGTECQVTECKVDRVPSDQVPSDQVPSGTKCQVGQV